MKAHTQWANRPADQRFQTIEALAEAVSKRRNLSRASDVDLAVVDAEVETIDDKETIVLTNGKRHVEPSHWSFGQFSGIIGAPASYLRTLPPHLAVQNIRHGISVKAGEVGQRKFMTVIDEDGKLNTLQAVTSTTYGRIWDADCVNAVQQLNERTGNKFYNPKAYSRETGEPVPSGLYASDRDIFIFMIDGGSMFDLGERAKLNRGFIVTNSEVGCKTFSLTTFLFNTVCGNHIIWGAQNVNELIIRHTKNGPQRFIDEAAPTLLSYVNASAEAETTVVKRAMDFLIPVSQAALADSKKLKEETIAWVRSKGRFSNGEVAEAIDYCNTEDGDCRTLWQIVQGLTASAREITFADARVDLESRAGNLLDLVSDK